MVTTQAGLLNPDFAKPTKDTYTTNLTTNNLVMKPYYASVPLLQSSALVLPLVSTSAAHKLAMHGSCA
jgi:hypothetical protein